MWECLSPRCLLTGRLPLFLDPLQVVRRAPSVLSGLIDDYCRAALRRIEFADPEAIEPGFVAACQTVNLGAPDVPGA